jgi:hypothetical protein
MNTNVNLAAPLGVLALLGTGLVIAVAGVFLIYSLIVHRFGSAMLVALALLAAGGLQEPDLADQ